MQRDPKFRPKIPNGSSNHFSPSISQVKVQKPVGLAPKSEGWGSCILKPLSTVSRLSEATRGCPAVAELLMDARRHSSINTARADTGMFWEPWWRDVQGAMRPPHPLRALQRVNGAPAKQTPPWAPGGLRVRCGPLALTPWRQAPDLSLQSTFPKKVLTQAVVPSTGGVVAAQGAAHRQALLGGAQGGHPSGVGKGRPWGLFLGDLWAAANPHPEPGAASGTHHPGALCADDGHHHADTRL